MSPLLTDAAIGAVSFEMLEKFQAEFASSPERLQAMNAVTTTPVAKIALDRRTVAKIDHSFSVQLDENPATSQKKSGRCWMFAALNTLRYTAQKSLNVPAGFELSQNYTLFWDKFEKANYFLENILLTLEEPTGSRLLDFLLSGPVQDGGQWDMFVNLIEKYGVVPKSVMPETESSSNTGAMSAFITGKLREYACRLRSAASNGASSDSLRSQKLAFLDEIYKVLCIHLGEPPAKFNWQWRDKDKAFRSDGEITPLEFYRRYIGTNLTDKVCLIHDPRPGHDFGKPFTVKFLGNVVGGQPTLYLNAKIDEVKDAAIETLRQGNPVWFGCDVGKSLDRDLGVMDTDLFDSESVYGTEISMNKAERLMYGHSQMTHAMVFTGVDLGENGSPKKWRVENSWSAEPGDKGFFQMSDKWFDEYMYEVVVDKSMLPADLQAALDLAPVELDPWDPMGSLA